MLMSVRIIHVMLRPMLGATTWWEVTSVSAEKDMPSMKTRNAYVSDY